MNYKHFFAIMLIAAPSICMESPELKKRKATDRQLSSKKRKLDENKPYFDEVLPEDIRKNIASYVEPQNLFFQLTFYKAKSFYQKDADLLIKKFAERSDEHAKIWRDQLKRHNRMSKKSRNAAKVLIEARQLEINDFLIKISFAYTSLKKIQDLLENSIRAILKQKVYFVGENATFTPTGMEFGKKDGAITNMGDLLSIRLVNYDELTAQKKMQLIAMGGLEIDRDRFSLVGIETKMLSDK